MGALCSGHIDGGPDSEEDNIDENEASDGAENITLIKLLSNREII